MITIVAAREKDADLLSEVVCGSIRELCAADHHDDPELIARWVANKTPGHFACRIADPRSTLLLARRSGEPAGVGCARDDGEVTLNYVAPAHRFRGVSRALLASLEANLVEKGIKSARLLTTKTAHRFYREAGWMEVGEPRGAFGIVGYPMEKNLAR